MGFIGAQYIETEEEPLQELTLDALRLAFVDVVPIDEGILHLDNVENNSGEAVIIPTTPETVLEAILFVGTPDHSPITVEKCCDLLRNVTPEEIRHIVDSLNFRYETSGAPQRIVWGHEKPSERQEPEKLLSLRMVLHESFHGELEKFSGKTRETQLSQMAIEILALVAYRQPVTAEEIQQIRKASVGSLLSQLVRRELLTADPLQNGKRKVTQYRTTQRFLDIFGLSSLADLPTADEMEML